MNGDVIMEYKTSEIMRALYEQSGLSYSAMARALGIKRNTLATWLRGKRNPSPLVVDMACIKLNVDKDDILKRLKGE